jgi:hypothetical protein
MAAMAVDKNAIQVELSSWMMAYVGDPEAEVSGRVSVQHPSKRRNRR